MPKATLGDVEQVVRTIATVAVENEKYFGDLDAVVGDGDFGYSIDCPGCGPGASNAKPGPLTFTVSKPGGLTPAAFIANAGGLINNAALLDGYERAGVLRDCARIGETLAEVFELADRSSTSTNAAATDLARQRTQNLREPVLM